MPDPWTPPATDQVVGTINQSAADALGRPVFIPNPKPVAPQPRQLKGNYSVDLNSGTATPIKGLPPDTGDQRDRKQIVNGSVVDLDTGKAVPIDGLQGAASPSRLNPDAAFQDDKVIQTIRHVADLAEAPGSVGPGTDYLQHIPILGNNASALRGQLAQITGDLLPKGIALINAANSGKGGSADARSIQTQKALVSSFAAIDPSQPYSEFKRGLLDQALPQYMRWKVESLGLDPDDPQVAQRYGLTPVEGAGTPSTTPPPPSVRPQISPGERPDAITASNPLPPISMKDAASISSDQKIATSLALARISDQLTQYLNADPKKVSNAQIVGFMQKNGVDPATTNLGQLLQMRATGKYKGFTVDPRYNVPLQGVDKVRAAISASPAAAAVAAAGDQATLGAIPDIVGALSSDPNARANFIYGQNAIAQAHPTASLLGDIAGSLPLAAMLPAEGVGQIALGNAVLGGVHGALSSEDPSLGARAGNAGLEGLTNLLMTPVAHGALSLAGKGLGAAGRFAAGAAGADTERLANQEVLNRFASGAPKQNLEDVAQNIAAQNEANAGPSVATALDVKGQDYLGKVASGSPQGQAAAEQAVQSWRKALPARIGQDFDRAIADSAQASRNPQAADFLNRPVTDVRDDIQGLAGREYERGMQPIVNERVTVDPDLAKALDQEPVKTAIGLALRNQSLTPETRAVLRSVPQWLKEGADLKNLPVTVDALRNVATVIDDQAGRLQEGSEARMVRRNLASTIRQSIGDQFPEYKPVNDLYASRMRGIDALLDTRDRFGTNTDTAMDELIKAGRKLSDQPQAGEFNGSAAASGPDLPSTRQMAMAGAKESAVRDAGANARGSADAVVQDIAGASNQATRTRTVFPEAAARDIEAGAAAKAANMNALGKIAGNGSATGKSNIWRHAFQSVLDAGIGAKGAAVGAALRGVPNMGSRESARIVQILTDSNNPEQALAMLRKAYSARRAQFIADRVAAFGASTYATRPREPTPPAAN